MKTKLLILVCSAIFISMSNTQILLDENFNYTAGDSLGAHGWVSFSGGATNVLSVVTPGLVYSGYPLSGIGNSCRVRNNGQDAYKNASDSATSNSIYASFMVNVDSARGIGDYFFAFLPGSSTTNYFGRFYVKDTTGGISFGISKGAFASNPVVWSPGTYIRGTTYLVVVKYTFLSGAADDEASAYIFTSGIPGTEPGTPTIGPGTGTTTDPTGLGRIALRQGSSTLAGTLNVDGIRVARVWANLVSVQTISTTADEFSLKQNYPNPFNPNTNIQFSLKTSSEVTLKVFDVMGREVSSIFSGRLGSGVHVVNFDASSTSGGLSSGTYFYTIKINSDNGESFSDTKKLVLIK